MPQVVLTPQAEGSRIEIWLYIAEDNPAAADRLISTIDEKCRLIATQPLMGRVRPDLAPDVRSFLVGDYVIIYRPADDGIELLLAVHGSRDIPVVFREQYLSPPTN